MNFARSSQQRKEQTFCMQIAFLEKIGQGQLGRSGRDAIVVLYSWHRDDVLNK